MEELYLLAFKINFLMSDKQLCEDYIHIVSEEDLTLQLADEYVEHDLLRSYRNQKPLQRHTFW